MKLLVVGVVAHLFLIVACIQQKEKNNERAKFLSGDAKAF